MVHIARVLTTFPFGASTGNFGIRSKLKFTVSDLKRLAGVVRTLGTREGNSLSAMLHREQPESCRIVDEVGMDPRCIEAHRC